MPINPISHKPRQRIWSAGLLAGCRVGLPARAEINNRQRKADESAPQVQPARLHPLEEDTTPPPKFAGFHKIFARFCGLELGPNQSASDSIHPHPHRGCGEMRRLEAEKRNRKSAFFL